MPTTAEFTPLFYPSIPIPEQYVWTPVRRSKIESKSTPRSLLSTAHSSTTATNSTRSKSGPKKHLKRVARKLCAWKTYLPSRTPSRTPSRAPMQEEMQEVVLESESEVEEIDEWSIKTLRCGKEGRKRKAFLKGLKTFWDALAIFPAQPLSLR